MTCIKKIIIYLKYKILSQFLRIENKFIFFLQGEIIMLKFILKNELKILSQFFKINFINIK